MTFDEFDSATFGPKMMFTYMGEVYHLFSVNFNERLLGLSSFDEPDVLLWVRCENAELIED
jgi:hypothetical protein